MHNYPNRISSIRIPVKPGCQVYVIGFPSSLSSGFGLPIWKSGYIASEPAYDVILGGKLSEFGGMRGGTKIPAIFIDSLTRSGMSGSPVFASYTGNWDITDPYREIEPGSPESGIGTMLHLMSIEWNSWGYTAGAFLLLKEKPLSGSA